MNGQHNLHCGGGGDSTGAYRDWWICLFTGIKIVTGCDHKKPDLTSELSLLWVREWMRRPAELPSDLNYSGFIWQYFAKMFHVISYFFFLSFYPKPVFLDHIQQKHKRLWKLYLGSRVLFFLVLINSIDWIISIILNMKLLIHCW